jgi:hypothetical protein
MMPRNETIAAPMKANMAGCSGPVQQRRGVQCGASGLRSAMHLHAARIPHTLHKA